MDFLIDYFNLFIFGCGILSVFIFLYCKNKERYTVLQLQIQDANQEENEYIKIDYISFAELNSLEHEENYKENTSNVVCSICLEEYVYNETISVMSCNHKFHEECLRDWLQKSKACPLCNNV
jgi:hypothetical protein